MRQFLLMIFFTSASLLSICGQTSKSVSFDVAGLNPDGDYTDQEMRQALGQYPDEFHSQDDELGGMRMYMYGKRGARNIFYYSIEHKINFRLSTSAYALFNGRIRVGDPVSKLSTLGGGMLKKQNDKLYFFFPMGFLTDNYLEVGVNSSGTIIYLRYFPPS